MEATTPAYITQIREGQRFRLRRDVERYPHFTAPAGMLGTIATVDYGEICLCMDEMLEGAEDWENEICWSDCMEADGDLLKCFLEDCERVIAPSLRITMFDTPSPALVVGAPSSTPTRTMVEDSLMIGDYFEDNDPGSVTEETYQAALAGLRWSRLWLEEEAVWRVELNRSIGQTERVTWFNTVDSETLDDVRAHWNQLVRDFHWHLAAPPIRIVSIEKATVHQHLKEFFYELAREEGW